jgi:hypothetical protein
MTGKTNLRYIEKIALEWANAGITDARKRRICEKIHRLKEYKNKIRKIIHHRPELSPSEENYIARWQEFCMEDDLVSLLRQNGDENGKAAFPYMNIILSPGTRKATGSSKTFWTRKSPRSGASGKKAPKGPRRWTPAILITTSSSAFPESILKTPAARGEANGVRSQT